MHKSQDLTSWAILLRKEMKANGDSYDEKVCTLSEEELQTEFDSGYGDPKGQPFTAWGETYVYFPVCYDGSESVGSVPRNPCKIATKHIGSW